MNDPRSLPLRRRLLATLVACALTAAYLSAAVALWGRGASSAPPIARPADDARLCNYAATIDRAVDGDTVVATVDVCPAERMKLTATLRLLGVNCPELHAPDHLPGEAAKAYTEGRIVGHDVVIRARKKDSFGRWLTWVTVDGVDFNAELIQAGHAVPFMLEKSKVPPVPGKAK